jgi:outer membrane protein assembly factor BamA
VEGGYSEFEGWFLSPLSVRYNNPFGRGYGLALKSYIGDRMGGVSLLFNAPYIFNSDYWLNFEAFGRGHDYIHYLDETQWVQKTDMGGARFDFGGHTGLFKYLNFALQSKNVTPHKELHDEKADIKIYDLPTAIAADTAKARLNSGFITLSGDTRNNTDYPTRGIWASISAENTTEKLQETFRYTKIIADGRMYQKIGRYDVLALRLKIGQTDAETPFYERFYLGGAMSVRGFPERTLTPIGWGTHLLLSNLEYRFPLSRSGFPKHRWTAAFFVDTGAIWQSPSEISASDFTGSWGFGIRVRVPVLGLVRLDLAKPLLDEKARLHLSLGHTF